jgi:hypothetical protein
MSTAASKPSLTRALVWFALLHVAPLALMIAGSVLPTDFDTISVTHTRTGTGHQLATALHHIAWE